MDLDAGAENMGADDMQVEGSCQKKKKKSFGGQRSASNEGEESWEAV